MTYRAVYCLWISPDFSEVEAGRAIPPRVNHDKINFMALADLLQSVFRLGPPKRTLVPNDTIDQTTIHTRLGMVGLPRKPGKGSFRCEDFGEALLAAAKKTTGQVVDIRAAWRPLHFLEDRVFAPPPSGIVFVVETKDFEDNIISGASMRPVIGLPMIGPGFQAPQENESGRLPDELKSGLERIFGCPFERECIVDRIAQEAAPVEYGDIFNPAIQEQLRTEQSKFSAAAQKSRAKGKGSRK